MMKSLLFAIAATAASVSGHLDDHRYKQDEHVELWVNKVGPYANPQEAYEYYELPYCAPDTKHHPSAEDARFNSLKTHSMAERLGGHSLRHSGHDVTFHPGTDTVKSESCTTKPLTQHQAQRFAKAVQHRWFYQMYLDDLPVWGMVGEMLPPDAAGVEKQEKDDLDRLDHLGDIEEPGNLKPYVYTNRNLIISYNNDQIVKVDLTSDPKSLEEIKDGKQLTFTLFVSYAETQENFHSRFDRYLDHDFFKHPIHWFSVFNSFMMVLFLTGLVALILLRTLKRDYARYGLLQDIEEPSHNELDEDGKPLVPEDSGWKLVHGDVFRAPYYLPFFAALLGTGWQLVILTLGVIMFAVLGPLHGEVHEERGEVLHAILVCYSLSSIVSGYSSGQFFKIYHSTTAKPKTGEPPSSLWQITMGITVLLLPTVTSIILSCLNSISLWYGTINTIPFMVLLKLFFLWVFVSVPLCVLGTLVGRHSKLVGTVGASQFPCRINALPRPIPENVPWYGKPEGLIPLAGLLSFGSIFIELYYVLTSLWNYKFYHVYGFLLGVYAILAIVVGMSSIIVVYFCLNAENHLWQWTSFFSGASTAGYVFLYGIYYYNFKTQMNGFLQFSFYFGYMGLISIALGLLCGTLGHFAASKFVRAIFANVKVD